MMKRAILSLIAAALAGLLTAGCSTFSMSPKQAVPPEPISAPQDEPPPSEKRSSPARYAESEPRAGGEDSAVARLSEKIQGYAARFPTTDLDRASAESLEDEPPAAPATRPARTASAGRSRPKTKTSEASSGPVAIPDPVTVEQAQPAQAPIASHGGGETTETEAGSDVLVPNRPAHTDVAASPQPHRIAAPAPKALSSALRVEIMDIRPAGPPSPVSDGGQPGANRPTPAPDSGGKGIDVSALITRLEGLVRQNPQQLDDQLRLRMLYLATGQTEKATAPVKDVDPMQGEIMTALFKAVAATQEALKDPTGGAASALAASGELNRLVGEQSPVVIPKVALVTKVDDFGNYQAVSPPAFPAGRPVHVYLYTEVANFRSQPAGDGRLRTLLGAKLEVFDALGKAVWQRGFPQIEDRVYSPRRDFFVPLEIKLPPDTPPGEYVVKVTIEDKLGATADQQRLSFTIGAP